MLYRKISRISSYWFVKVIVIVFRSYICFPFTFS
nr:MAG TPA: hypothetical protein [Caudoviricetes sp.]